MQDIYLQALQHESLLAIMSHRAQSVCSLMSNAESAHLPVNMLPVLCTLLHRDVQLILHICAYGAADILLCAFLQPSFAAPLC